MSKSVSIMGLLIFGLLVIASQSLFIIPETQQVIVMQFGDPVAQYSKPGLKAKIPLIQNIKTFDSRVLEVDPPAEQVILTDQKRVVVDTFARYKISDMLKFYQTLGTERQAVARLHNLINSAVRGDLGGVTLNDILSPKRSEIMNTISNKVNDSVQRFGLEIVDIRIVRADLPPQTSQAIYSRMRSEREREAKEFRAQGKELAQQIRSKADKERVILLAEAKKTSQILRGEGDEIAISTYAKAFKKDTEFYAFYRTMEAYRESLTDDSTTFVLSPESEFFGFFNNSKKSKR